MDYEEILRTLDVKEISILFWKMRGYSDAEVGRKFGKGEDWVAKEMTPIYQKLDFPSMPPKLKAAKLRDEVLPIVKILTNDDEDTLVNWPLKAVNVDIPHREKVEKVEKTVDKTVDKAVDNTRRQYSLNIWYVLILVILAAFIGYFVRPVLQPVETPALVTVIVTATPDEFNTPPPSVAPTENPDGVGANPTDNPIDTAIPETPTTQPSETPVPTDPATPLPAGFTFIDDFDDGLDPFWNRRFGAPLIVDRQLTSSEPLDLSLGDSSWGNYQVEFDYVGKFEDCDLGPNSNTLGIRAQDQNNMLVYVFSRCYQEWQYMVDGQWTAIPGTRHGGLMSPIHIVVTVEGNEITYYNRSELLGSFIVEGYDSGPVYLHVKPGAQYDNFKVTILP